MRKYYTCGNCGIIKSYDEDYPALSRKDNKTDLCSKCGQEEAMKEYMNWLFVSKKYGVMIGDDND